MQKANRKVISRLSRYRNLIYKFKEFGLKNVCSDEIARALNITSAQVRKDFSIAGISGKKKGGYLIEKLNADINKLLSKDDTKKIILCGSGALAQAIIAERIFDADGMKVIAVFDNHPVRSEIVVGKNIIPVMPAENLIAFAAKEKIKFGIIATSGSAAQQMLDFMALAGIRGVLSFAPIELKGPPSCVVRSVNFAHEFENLIYFACNK